MLGDAFAASIIAHMLGEKVENHRKGSNDDEDYVEESEESMTAENNVEIGNVTGE